MSRVPRKKKKRIPKDTFYCYTPISTPGFMSDGEWGYKIKPCPYYKHIEGLDGHCSLLNCEITDQVKECGERYGM